MASFSSTTLEELHCSHVSERSILARLLFHLNRDPAESLLVMSVWAWLDSQTSHDVTLSSALLDQCDNILDSIANEATLSLGCLQSRIPLGDGGRLPMTAKILNNPDLSLTCFMCHKYTAIYYIKSLFKNVCPWVFSDVVLHAIGPRAPQIGLVIFSCRRYATFGSAELVTRPIDCQIPFAAIWNWRFQNQDPKDERTIFLTFSQGFPVTETEVLNLFANKFGYDCIESLKMKTKEPHTQSLFAKLVVRSLAHMDLILDGNYLIKFRINGKHIWARKFERH